MLLSRVSIVVVAALCACGGTVEPAPATTPSPAVATPTEPVEDAVDIVVLGDSLAAGLGLPSDQAWPAVVEQRLKAEGLAVRVQNAGVSGDTTAGGRARIDWLLKRSPEVVVVELGGNDLLRGLPVDAMEDNLAAILDAVTASGARAVLVAIQAPPTVGPDHQAAVRAVYERLGARTDVALADGFLDSVMGKPELLQADGLHPTAAGHKLLADPVIAVLKGVLVELE